MHLLRLIVTSIRLQYLTWANYRVDYFSGALTVLIEQAITISILGIIFTNVPSVEGWTFWEMVVIFGLSRIAVGFTDCVAENLWWVPAFARNGVLLTYLSRPTSVLLQLVLERMQFERLTGSITGIILTLYATQKLGAVPTVSGLLIIATFTLVGAIVYFALMVLGAALSLIVIGHGATTVQFLWSLVEFSKYPGNIYGSAGNVIFTTILPLGLAGYVPAAILLNPNALPHPLVPVAGIFSSLLLFLLSLRTWKAALHQYEGTGT